MGSVTDWFLSGMLPGLLLSGGVWAWTALRSLAGARRRWQLGSADSVRICLAESTRVHTGEYHKPATGIGQAKALAVIAPSLTRAWPAFDFQAVYFPSELRGSDLEGDLIMLGGPKHNPITRQVLDVVGASFGIDQQGSDIIIGDRIYRGATSADDVETDYGLIVRAPNPFCPSRTAIILSGSHTYGVTGAARFFVEDPRFVRTQKPTAVLIEMAVTKGHAFPPTAIWSSPSVRSR